MEQTENENKAAGAPSALNVGFDLIYADPPWRYSFSKSDSRKIENQYPSMTTPDICALTVPANKDCVLYLWATAPKLIDALEVMKAWRFEYKTHCVWDKQKIGMGFWFRGQHELLLVGVRGKVSPPKQCDRTSSVFSFIRGKHSKKPDEIRDLISGWFPDKKKLEMFCRAPADGWSVWGNQVNSDIEMGPNA